MYLITSTVDNKKSILVCCTYPDECYVFLVKNLKIKLQKAELLKQLQSLDIGASLRCNDSRLIGYGKLIITKIPSLSEYSFLTIPIENV